MGHIVTVVAPRGSDIPGAELIMPCDPSFANPEAEAYQQYQTRLDEFDIVHDHSVGYDETIILTRDGKTSQERIGSYIDSLMAEMEPDNIGSTDILTLPTSIEHNVLTMGEDFKIFPARIHQVIRHKTDGCIYKVDLEEGKSITLTGKHALFTLSDYGEIRPISALDAEGKFVAIPTKLNHLTSIEPISININDLPENLLLTGTDVTRNVKDNHKALIAELRDNGSKYNTAHTRVCHWQKKGYIPLRYAKKYKGIWNKCSIWGHHSQVSIPIQFKPDDNTLTLFGLWLADGCYDRENIRFSVGQDCFNLVKRVAGSFRCNTNSPSYRPDINITICSRVLVEVMKAIGFNGTANTKRVPVWVFGLPKNQIGAFLKGYFSGDGSISKRHGVRVSSISEPLIRDISTLLLQLGIRSHIGYAKKIGGFSTKTMGLYELGIAKEQTPNFIKQIGFIQETRNNITVLPKPSKRGAFPIIKPLDKLFTPKSHFSVQGERTSYANLERILRRLKKYESRYSSEWKNDVRQTIDLLEKALSGDIAWAKVRKVQKIKYKHPYVYDLAVLSSQRFICSNILVHNSWAGFPYIWKINQNPSLKLIHTVHSMQPWTSPPPLKYPCLCAASKYQAELISSWSGCHCEYVWHGIDLDTYKFSEHKEDYLLYVARVVPFKGAHEFVALCRRLGMKGILVGEDIYIDQADQPYARRVMDSCDGKQVIYYGRVPRGSDLMVELMGNAKALICPLLPNYSEIFGLTTVEAAACGTAVISTDRGAARELILQGKTGYVVPTVADLDDAVHKIEKIEPKDCRKRAEEFDRKFMAENYVKLFERMLKGYEW